MPSGATETAEPALLLLQQRLQGLGLRQRGALEPPGKDEEDGGGEAELREDEDEEEEEDDDEADAAALLLPSPLFAPLEAAEGAAGARGMMAAMLSNAYGGAPALGGEQAALLRRKSVNTTECVPVPSSEHVAEIVGRQDKTLPSPTNEGTRLNDKKPLAALQRCQKVSPVAVARLSCCRFLRWKGRAQARPGGQGLSSWCPFGCLVQSRVKQFQGKEKKNQKLQSGELLCLG